jgi:hypothetical protein
MMPKNAKHRLKITDTYTHTELSRITKKWKCIIRIFKSENSNTKKIMFLVNYEKRIMSKKQITHNEIIHGQHHRRHTNGILRSEGIFLITKINV